MNNNKNQNSSNSQKQEQANPQANKELKERQKLNFLLEAFRQADAETKE